MGLAIRGWRQVHLGVGMGGFGDQEVETGGFSDQGWRQLRVRVDTVGFGNQGVETGRFRGGDG